MENEGGVGVGRKSQKYFLSFHKNIKKLESNQNVSLCVLRLEKGHLTSSPAVTLAVGNIATLSLQAAYCIKTNLKISFLPKDMQEHELKLAVRKTEVWTDKKKFLFFF